MLLKSLIKIFFNFYHFLFFFFQIKSYCSSVDLTLRSMLYNSTTSTQLYKNPLCINIYNNKNYQVRQVSHFRRLGCLQISHLIH